MTSRNSWLDSHNEYSRVGSRVLQGFAFDWGPHGQVFVRGVVGTWDSTTFPWRVAQVSFA
jgi:hypothetical protein